ncbi:MAG: Card1-like endonuclease domain-containing protein [Gammaproteobacteria bacterium]
MAAAQQAHDLKLWTWDKTANTITIANQHAFEFLNGGWVEEFALVTLDDSGYFDEVLANVEVQDFAGEMDVAATLNGRLGIIECKTTGPAKGERKASVIVKYLMHEHMFGGLYAKAILALPSNEDITDWKKLCDQYDVAHPIHSDELKYLANTMYRLLTPI